MLCSKSRFVGSDLVGFGFAGFVGFVWSKQRSY